MDAQLRDRRSKPWFWVHKTVITKYGRLIGPYGIAVYCYLGMRANDEGQCFPKQSTIADETGMSRKSVNEAIGKLRAYKLIETETTKFGNGYNSHLIYILVDPPEIVPQMSPPVTSEVTPENGSSSPELQHEQESDLNESSLNNEESINILSDINREPCSQPSLAFSNVEVVEEKDPPVTSKPKSSSAPKKRTRSCGQEIYFQVFGKMPQASGTGMLDQAVYKLGEQLVKCRLAEWQMRRFNPNNYLGLEDVIYNDFIDKRLPLPGANSNAAPTLRPGPISKVRQSMENGTNAFQILRDKQRTINI